MPWYCLQTAPQRELSVAYALGEVGCGVYVPTRWVERARRGREKRGDKLRVALALFPGYIFVLAEQNALYSAIERAEDDSWRRGRVSYVRGVLAADGAPIAIGQHTIDAIVRIENDLRFVPAPAVALILSIGDRVTITLDGRTGTVTKAPRQGKVKLDFGDCRQTVPVASVRLAA
jgi:transcription antitermination factor NusG